MTSLHLPGRHGQLLASWTEIIKQGNYTNMSLYSKGSIEDKDYNTNTASEEWRK